MCVATPFAESPGPYAVLLLLLVWPLLSLQMVIYRGPRDVARHVIASEGGVLGLYKGLVPTLWREGLGNVAMFGVYELVKQWLAEYKVGGGNGTVNGDVAYQILRQGVGRGWGRDSRVGQAWLLLLDCLVMS